MKQNSPQWRHVPRLHTFVLHCLHALHPQEIQDPVRTLRSKSPSFSTNISASLLTCFGFSEVGFLLLLLRFFSSVLVGFISKLTNPTRTYFIRSTHGRKRSKVSTPMLFDDIPLSWSYKSTLLYYCTSFNVCSRVF